MLQAPGMEEAARWYLDATIQAGREVASSGRIAQETQAVLDRPLVADAGRYADTVNGYWRSYGVEMPGDVTSSEPSSGTPMEPSPDTETVRDLVSRLPAALAPGEAGDLQAAIQFDVSGEEPGAYYVVIENGACAAYEGTHPSPRVTIHSPADVWLKVNRGELDGATAFMSGQFTATGDVSLLMRFAALFSGG